MFDLEPSGQHTGHNRQSMIAYQIIWGKISRVILCCFLELLKYGSNGVTLVKPLGALQLKLPTVVRNARPSNLWEERQAEAERINRLSNLPAAAKRMVRERYLGPLEEAVGEREGER